MATTTRVAAFAAGLITPERSRSSYAAEAKPIIPPHTIKGTSYISLDVVEEAT